MLEWQIDLATRLGCKRIICLCDQAGAELLRLQRSVETAGGEFHAIRNSLQLIALLRADDTLLVIADGLFAEPDRVAKFVLSESELSRAVYTLPFDHELPQTFPEDFERIDAARSWAGVLAMRAAPVQKLADLPPDGDPVSLLLRLALQAQTDIRPWPANGEGLFLVSDSAQAERRERELVERAAPALQFAAPTEALAALLVTLLSPTGLQRGALLSGGASLVLALAGAMLAYLGHPIAGITSAAIAAFFGALTIAWKRLSTALLKGGGVERFSWKFRWMIDILSAATLVFALPAVSFPMAALAILALGLSRFASQTGPKLVAPFWNDRTVHLAIFAISAIYGVLSEALATFGLVALAQVLFDQVRGKVSIGK